MALSDKGLERAILAGICQNGVDGYFEISDLSQDGIFTDTKNSMIFHCLEYLFENDIQRVDVAGIVTAATALNYIDNIYKTNQDQEFIRSLFSFPIELSNLRKYFIRLVSLWVARQSQSFHKIAHDELNEINGEESIDNIINISEKPFQSIIKLLNRSDDCDNIGSGIEDYIKNKIDNPIQNIGIPTQFPIFNSVIGDGLRTGVHLIASRFKNGKSTFGKEVALHVSKNLNIPTIYLDTEMSYEEQLDRILSSVSNIPTRKIEKGQLSSEEINRLIESGKQIKNIPLKHVKISGRPFNEVLGILRRWINHTVGYGSNGKPNPHFVIYDYFKLMNTSDLNNLKEYEAMGFQISAMHDFCQEYNTPILSFVQTNRDGITKDSTDIIAQSDRLGWNAISISIWKRKTSDEIAKDGVKNGTNKLIPLEGRFMNRLNDGDYINFYFDSEKSIIKEINTNSQAQYDS